MTLRDKNIDIPNEEKDFEQLFASLAEELIQGLDKYNLPLEGIAHLRAMIYATVPGGKMNRGLTVASGLASIMKRDLTEKERTDANILGWCVEWVQLPSILTNSKATSVLPCGG